MISSASSRPTISLGAVAERLLGGAVDLDDVAGGVHRDDAVERRVEDRALARVALAQAVLGAPALDALADPAAEARDGVEQVGVGVARLAREELDRAEHAAGAADREAEAGVQAGLERARRAREVRVGADVRDPRRLAAGEHAAGQALAGREPDAVGDPLPRRRRVPRLDAAQHARRRAPPAPRSRRRPSRAARRSRRAAAGTPTPPRRTPPARARPHARPCSRTAGSCGVRSCNRAPCAIARSRP